MAPCLHVKIRLTCVCGYPRTFHVTNPSSWHVVRVEIVERQPHDVEQLDSLYLNSIYLGRLAQILYICGENYRVDYNT